VETSLDELSVSTSEPATQGDRDAASPDPEVAQSTQSEPLAESEVQQIESSEVQQLESSASSLPIDDFEIIPGEKFSFITASTNRRALAEQVGEAQLVDEEVHIGEGFFEPGTAVDLGDYSFKVVWSDNSRTTPIEIRELGPAWELPNGIQLGMPFEDLKTTLGEFEIFGMGWDYAGTVMLDNTTLDSYREDLILRMEPAVGVAETFSDDFQAVLGDELFNSANPHFSSLDLTLEEIIVYLE
ncbi:MAG: hypothetical protein AAFQ57_05560, partial [Cyanobacteria bacterium J06626_14]